MCIGSPNDLAIVVSRRSSIVRSGEHDEAQAADLVPVDGLAGLRLQPAVHLDRLFEHPRRVARRAQLTDQPGGVPRRAVGELVLLEDTTSRSPFFVRQ